MRHPQKGRQDLDLSLTTAVPEKECGVKDKSAPHPKNRFRHYRSAEFRVDGLDVPYQFRIWDITPACICVLVNENSALLPRLKVGDTLKVRYYARGSSYSSNYQKSAIRHITRSDQGRLKGHYVVGLEILEG
jgi:hypothetical protein